MKFNLPFISIGAIVAIIIFAYMRNRQAARNDERRGKLAEKTEKLIELLKKNNSDKENPSQNEG